MKKKENQKENRLNAYLVLVILICAVTAWLTKGQGLGLKNPENDKKTEISDTREEADEQQEDQKTDLKEPEKPEDTGSEVKENPTNPPVEEKEPEIIMERIGIYTIDEETLETASVTAMLDVTDGLSVKAVVEAVRLAMEDHSIEIQLGEIRIDGNKVVVDILAEEAVLPFGNAGSAVEGVILDCISYSVFDNFAEIEEIYFTVNGDTYESGHIYLPMDEAYLTK